MSSPGLNEVEDVTTEGILAVKFIIGLDFALTRSSHDSCWIRFAIAAVQAVELKWLMLNKLNKWFTCETSFGQDVCELVLVSMYLICFLVSRLIRSNNQSRATLWVLETCLIVGLLQWSSWSLLHCLQTYTIKLLGARIEHLKEQHQCLSSHRSFLETHDICEHHYQVAPIDLKHGKCFQRTETIKSHDSRAGKPRTETINLSPVSKEMISDSVELWETAVCFLHIQLIGTKVWLPKTHNVPPEVDFESARSPAKSKSLKQSQSALFGSITHMMNVRYQTIQAFCHMLWSISWWIVRAYLLTIEYQVVQFVPSISISKQFESIHVTILQQILFLPLWSGGHRCME